MAYNNYGGSLGGGGFNNSNNQNRQNNLRNLRNLTTQEQLVADQAVTKWRNQQNQNQQQAFM